MKKLANKIALVTGGSRGIGAAIVNRLAADGASVAFTYTSDSSAEKAGSLVSIIQDAGGRALAIKANSRNPDEVINAVNSTVSEFGGLDILVNNAGILTIKDISELTIADYDELMDVNVKAVFVAASEAVKHLKSGGRIISIGSNMGDNAIMPKTTLYTMSKSALQGFTRALSRDLGPKGITVTLVQPGPTNTDMNPEDTELAEYFRTRMALGKYGSPEDVAALVAFLASDESKNITGTFLTTDSGFNA
jgi:3-oxoacyl-[acyl-carrier protein] reductase